MLQLIHLPGMSHSDSATLGALVRRSEEIDRIAEGGLDVRRYIPAWRDRRSGPHDAFDDRRSQSGRARQSQDLPPAPSRPCEASRPLLVILGNAPGPLCEPACYSVFTLGQAFADCDSIVILPGAVSELLYHGVARYASGYRKTTLIETEPAAVGAWLSAVRRHAAPTAQVTIEPNDAAFPNGGAALPRA
jgi:hypothetical protein